MPPMKKLHDTYCSFYITKNEDNFWVRDDMHFMQLITSKKADGQRCIYAADFSKTTQNTLLE
jgi:hypothetical protein